jgi:hypothetical protein
MPSTVDFEAWYLDDGTVGGPIPLVEQYVTALELAGARIGLELRPDKCHVILRSDEDPSTLPPTLASIGSRGVSTHWTILGCPVGNAASAIEHCSRVADRVIHKCLRIAPVPDVQVGFALLRFCGSFALTNFYVRAVGPTAQSEFARIDTAIGPILSNLGLSLPISSELLEAPSRYGGLGLRSLAQYSAVVFLAVWAAARLLRRFIMSESSMTRLLTWEDPFLLAASQYGHCHAQHAQALCCRCCPDDI